MRVVFLANYPLVDSKRWRQDLIAQVAKNHEVFVIFGKRSIAAHASAYLKRRTEIDVSARIGEKNIKTVPFLKQSGIPFYRTTNINHAETIAVLRKIRPDHAIVSIDDIIRSDVLANIPLALNAHYGNLPQIRGWNASEWEMLRLKTLHVSLHRVVAGVDTGEIYFKEPVPVHPQDTLEVMRNKCQDVAGRLHLRFLADPEQARREAMSNESGTSHFVMNRYLKKLTERIIQAR